MNHVPQELNWVKVRAECTIRSVFKAVRYGVEGDVRARNDCLTESQKDRGVSFTVEDKDDQTFEVHRKAPGLSDVVAVAIMGSSIKAMGRNLAVVEVSIGMNDGGRCTLRLGDVEIENWQFRKKTLENLFFPNVGWI